MLALKLILAAMFALSAVMFTGRFYLDMKGIKRVLAGFGMFAGMNVVSNLLVLSLGV